jgi:hypothetical protein
VSGALVIDGVVRDGDVHVTDEFYKTRRQRFAKRIGDGVLLKIRIEPADEAYTHGDIKHYWGHVVDPFCETTGYHKHEAHAMLKAECMPEGKTSITALNREELRAYTEAAEQTAREWCPEAFALMDRSQS